MNANIYQRSVVFCSVKCIANNSRVSTKVACYWIYNTFAVLVVARTNILSSMQFSRFTILRIGKYNTKRLRRFITFSCCRAIIYQLKMKCSFVCPKYLLIANNSIKSSGEFFDASSLAGIIKGIFQAE